MKITIVGAILILAGVIIVVLVLRNYGNGSQPSPRVAKPPNGPKTSIRSIGV